MCVGCEGRISASGPHLSARKKSLRGHGMMGITGERLGEGGRLATAGDDL